MPGVPSVRTSGGFLAQADLLQPDSVGLACREGGFHIDPWGACPIAVITHAHGDHARAGAGVYYTSLEGHQLLAHRLPPSSRIIPLAYGEAIVLGSTRVSLHPAGHVRGSAQVRVESARGEVWIASGDYKRQADGTCTPFEVVPCDVFITEATFALPIYRWPRTADEIKRLATWWKDASMRGHSCVVFSYALGKAQRLLHELWQLGGCAGFEWLRDERVLLHGAIAPLTQLYRDAGVPMLETATMTELEEDQPSEDADTEAHGRAAAPSRRRGTPRRSPETPRLAIAPPSAAGSTWMRRFGPASRVETGFASGWMQVRGVRARRGYDRGFVISDHADWPDLLRTIREVGARRVLATHGGTEALATYVRECMHLDAAPLSIAAPDYGTEE